jgi:hypothetical protein
MKNLFKNYKYLLIVLSVCMLGCTNQNIEISSTIMPTSNPCAKLNLLKSGYLDDFSTLKGTKISSRASDIWKANYQLFGKNCQIFYWGGEQHTYSCNLVAPNEEAANNYYENAKKITQQCLGSNWQAIESQRKHSDGFKTVFTNNDTQIKNSLTFSTHIVSSPGLFSDTWTLYYYVGNIKTPKQAHY